MGEARSEAWKAQVVARGRRVVLATPAEHDEEELLALRRASWEFLAPWELDLPGVDPLGHSWFVRYLRSGPSYRRERWLVRMRRSGAIRGSITLGEIDAQARKATIGYWISARHARRGLMGEALGHALERAFTLHALERIEAYVLPENEPSKRLLGKFGFQLSGIARGYQRLHGEDRDHERWVLASAQRPQSRR